MCKFKVGDKVKTRNGKDVEIVCVDERAKRPIIGVVFWEDSEATSASWYEDGIYIKGRPDHNLDLIPPSRTVTLYQAIVRRSSNGSYFATHDLFSSLDDDAVKDWNFGGYEFVRLLTEYPIEVEL